MPELNTPVSNRNAKIANEIFWLFHILYLAKNIIQYLEKALLGRTLIANLFSYGLFAFACLDVLMISDQKKQFRIFGAVHVIASALLANNVLFPNNTPFLLSKIKDIALINIPRLCVAANISDYQDFTRKMESYCPTYILMAWLLIFLNFSGILRLGQSDYMMIAYEILPAAAITGCLAIKRASAGLTLLYGLTSVMLLVIGCRGAFLCAGLVYICQLVFNLQNSQNANKVKRIIGVAVVGLIGFYFFIMRSLVELLLMMGVKIRILDLLVRGKLVDGSGRDAISSRILAYAKQKNFRPFGLFGDRMLGVKVGIGESYIHNLIYEFIIDFGIILGPLLLVWLVVWLYRECKTSSRERRTILILYASILFTKLMLSSSYLIDHLFYTMIGFLISREVTVAGKKEKIK